MNAKSPKIFVLAMLTGLVMPAVAAGQVSITSFAATTCVAGSGYLRHTVVDGQLANLNPNGGSGNVSVVSDYCPVVSNNAHFPAKSASSVDVYGWSTGADSITVKACRVSVAGWSASCSNPGKSTAVNNVDHISFNPASGGGWVSSSNDRDGYYLVIDYTWGTAIFNYSFTH